MVQYGDTVIAATACLHTSVSESLTQAEYVAVSQPAKMIARLRSVLNELGLQQQFTRIYKHYVGRIEGAKGDTRKHFQ